MRADPLRLSVSGVYTLRWTGIRSVQNGQATDPRNGAVLFTLLAPGTSTFGTWSPGTWEPGAPVGGPYVATIQVGRGEAIAPAVGVWVCYGQLPVPGAAPIFRLGTIVVEAP